VEDLQAILEIERASFPRPWTRAAFQREFELPFSWTVVLRRQPGAEPIAYACRWLIADEVQILNVAVHPEERRRGLGAALVRAVLWEGRGQGATSVYLEVARENSPGRQLYRSLGFSEVMVRPHYYGRDRDALLLRLALD
jgi:ribosomal-protein-alanine N-acetyltransferase